MNINTKWVAASAAAAVIAGAGGYLIGHRSIRTHDEQGTAVADANTGRKVLYWHDPMVPGARFEQPGKSPFMDMDLVPVYADEAGDSRVRIESNVAHNLGIRTGKVERKALTSGISAIGNIVFDERLVGVVQARVAGNVIRLHVKAPLVEVKRGQPLAEILAPEWYAAQQDYLALLEASAATEGIREAARQRLVVLGVPDENIRALETRRRADPTTTVFAPIDGIVTELDVREGTAFAAGAALVRINGLSTVWVNAQIPEAQVSLVASGGQITVSANAWPATAFKGRLLSLLPDVDPQTRTLTARIEVDNPQHRLSPGMFVSLSFSGSASTTQLVVPSEAVITTGQRSVVIVKDADGAFHAVEVKLGVETDGFTAILLGLEEGQQIVLSGQFLIDSEASLRATIGRLGTPTQAAPPSAIPSDHVHEQPSPPVPDRP